jgi:hypothetical protein
MLPQGFLGTRADILMDIVMVSLILIVPVVGYSYYLAHNRRDYRRHRRVQILLGSVLAVAVVLFETDLRIAGGIYALTAESQFTGTVALESSIWVHTLLAIITSLVWVVLTLVSLRKFPFPPKPGRFSPTHRLWGRIGMITMLLTGITAVPLYVLGFAY